MLVDNDIEGVSMEEAMDLEEECIPNSRQVILDYIDVEVAVEQSSVGRFLTLLTLSDSCTK